MRIQPLPMLLLALFAFIGPVCAGPPSPLIHIADSDEALTLQRELKAPQALDMSRLRVARMRLNGHPVEVTSLLPVVVAESRADKWPALTVFRFNEDRSALVLFTRSGKTGEGFRYDLAIETWSNGRVLDFPIVNEDGTLGNQRLELVKLLER